MSRYNRVFVHVTAIIAAGGPGERFGAGRPKQLLMLGGLPILQRSVDALSVTRASATWSVALPPELAAEHRPISANVPSRSSSSRAVPGGQDSVARGVSRDTVRPEIVVIHDAARPLVTADLIERTVAAAAADGRRRVAARARHRHREARRREGRVIETLPREHVYLAQTPQAFRVGVLRDALALTADATDEAALAERAGHRCGWSMASRRT
jgi:2-C-methyl-D-erythritol 4-phosphate cytidylyltransferase